MDRSQTLARRSIILVITLFLVLGVLSGAGQEEQGLHEFWTLDMTGEEVTEELFAPYRLTMINVWATYCTPCLHEMPDLAELHEEYRDNGVNIVGIVNDINFSGEEAFQRSIATANYIIQETGAHYTHLIPSEDLYNLRLKDVQVVPETFFVDSKGTIVGETIYGARDKAAWKTIIDSTIQLVE